MLLSTLFKNFEEYLKLSNKSASTIRNYMATSRRFISYVQSLHNGPVSVEKVTEEDIQKYLSDLKTSHNYKPASINVALNGIRKFFGYAIRKEIITKNPSQFVEGARLYKSKKDFLTKDEVTILLENIKHPIINLLVRTLYHAGLRISECTALTFDDLDFENDKIYVRNGKGNKPRTIPMSETLKPYLLNYKNGARKYIKDSSFFFATKKSGSISAAYVNRTLAEVTQKLKWKKHVTCHTLRHSFASQLVKKGVPLPMVAACLGHSDFRTVTSVYVHIEDEDLQLAVNQLIL